MMAVCSKLTVVKGKVIRGLNRWSCIYCFGLWMTFTWTWEVAEESEILSEILPSEALMFEVFALL